MLQVGHPCRRVFSSGLPWDVLQEEDGQGTVQVKLLCAGTAPLPTEETRDVVLGLTFCHDVPDEEASKHWAARLMPLPCIGVEKRVLVKLEQHKGEQAAPSFPVE